MTASRRLHDSPGEKNLVRFCLHVDEGKVGSDPSGGFWTDAKMLGVIILAMGFPKMQVNARSEWSHNVITGAGKLVTSRK